MKKKFHFVSFFLVVTQLFLSPAVFAAKGEKKAEKMGVVWGFDFLSSEEMITTDREGRFFLLNLKTKEKTAVAGAPKVFAKGQGGLMDVRLHPDFSKNRFVYFTYSYEENGKNTTRLARAKLENKALVDLQVLFTANAWSTNDVHFGSRIAFDGKGFLFLSVGERNEREKAQDLKVHNGKILRMKDDGSDVQIWSYGHRNPQGLFYDQATNKLWEGEHGPRGGDEINLIEKGHNYGWPVVSYGKEYWGPKISEQPTKKGITDPFYQFTPSIAACGLVIYHGDRYPDWKGSFFQGSLKLLHLNRLYQDKDKKWKEDRLFQDQYGRIRNIGQSPDGYLYFSTDSGEIYRIL